MREWMREFPDVQVTSTWESELHICQQCIQDNGITEDHPGLGTTEPDDVCDICSMQRPTRVIRGTYWANTPRLGRKGAIDAPGELAT